MAVRLITFDFTRTLADIQGNVGSIYAEVANRYYMAGSGVIFDAVEMLKYFKRSYFEVTKEIPCFGCHSSTGSEGWWFLVVERTLARSGLRDHRFVRSIANQLYTDFSTDKHWKLYPDVKDTLLGLRKKGLKLGILSNFDERLPNILEYLGLSENFDFVLCSGIIGVEKPATELFKLALSFADVSAEEAIHIGDDIEMDYKPPRTIGMKSLLIKRDSKEANKTSIANNRPESIATLSELIDICS